MTHRARHCRSCGGERLTAVLSLGETPLANSLLGKDELADPEPRFPLDLVFCADCALVQITDSVAPERLFRDYPYFSSFSDTMLQSAHALAERLIVDRVLGLDSLVAEIASNDGYLLKNYVAHAVPVLGIEPARNIAAAAVDKGVRTITEFFSAGLAAELVAHGKRADIIHANNVLAHVPDLNGVVAGMAAFLAPGGIIVSESPYVINMIDGVEFDTIYHEHLCYYSLTALDHLFRRHGLVIYDVETLAIHGGSLRIFARSSAGNVPETETTNARVNQSVTEMLELERGLGVFEPTFYAGFSAKVDLLGQRLIALLTRLKSEGKSIAAYGASAKGSTLLNHFGIGANVIDFVADRSTVKQGRYTPGTHLPIYAPEALLEAQPDYVLLLTWNFADEILRQQRAYHDRGGKFIIPIPDVRIL
jgi:SAM-dependent methyltransferase